MTPATRSRLIILTGAASVLLLFLHILGALSDAEAWAARSLSSATAGLSSTGESLRQTISAPLRVSDVMRENETLRTERDGLLVQLAKLNGLQDENDQLRKLLAFTKRQQKAPLVAHVLASSTDAGAHSIIIDRGTDDGVKPDMPVIVEDGIIVGKIFTAERTTSVALLLTDTRSRLGGAIQNASRTQGIIQGKQGLSLEMRLIPQDEDIAVGDLVVTSGIESLVPGGLVIGQVQDVQTEERNPFKTASIATPVPYDHLDIVAVLTP